ncbi:hypothetical protein [Asaia astilbis]|uniref:hypothetical protein n=1 Tax=Asaia astilbis TaxID=610244 RepID=UPI000A481839|nr:hypothetical protein [Asaia astilbis]
MSKPHDFHRADVRIAYPWPVEVQMPEDVSGVGIDEAIYGEKPAEEVSGSE